MGRTPTSTRPNVLIATEPETSLCERVRGELRLVVVESPVPSDDAHIFVFGLVPRHVEHCVNVSRSSHDETIIFCGDDMLAKGQGPDHEEGFFAFFTDDERPEPLPAAHFMNTDGAAFFGRGREPATLGVGLSGMISTGAAIG